KASPYCSATRISLGSAAAAASAVARESTSAVSRKVPRIRSPADLMLRGITRDCWAKVQPSGVECRRRLPGSFAAGWTTDVRLTPYSGQREPRHRLLVPVEPGAGRLGRQGLPAGDLQRPRENGHGPIDVLQEVR